MAHLLHGLVGFAKVHSYLAYALLVLLAGSEALPVIGAFMPGTLGVVAIAALIPTGTLNFIPVLACTMAGGCAGEELAYWLGRRYKQRIIRVWPFSRSPDLIARGERFFARHGRKSVVIARFTPGARAVVPLVAGAIGMPAVQFTSMNVISVVFWAPIHVGEGMLAGAGVELLGTIAVRLAILVVGFFVALGVLVWATISANRVLVRWAPRLQHRGLAWADRRQGWVYREIEALLDPADSEARAIVTLCLVVIGSLWLFGGVLQDVIARDPIVRANRVLLHLMRSLHVTWLDEVARLLASFGSAYVVLPVTVVVAAWIVLRRRRDALAYIVAAITGSAGAAVLLHVAVSDETWGTGSGWLRAPGWHTAVAAALIFGCTLLNSENANARLRFLLIGILLLFATNAARLYLGSASLSAVLLGLALGVAWSSLVGLPFLARRTLALSGSGLGTVALSAFVVAVGLETAFASPTTIRIYRSVEAVRTTSFAKWRTGGWTALPSRRVDALGEKGQPLSFQWAGRLSALKATLARGGWRKPVPWTFDSTFGWLASHARLGDLPVLPQLDNGRPEGLVMIYTRSPLAPPGNRIVLRLWKSDVRVVEPDGFSRPVWLGLVEEQRPDQVFPFVTIASARREITAPLQVLALSMPRSAIVERTASSNVRRGQVLLGWPRSTTRVGYAGAHQRLQ